MPVRSADGGEGAPVAQSPAVVLPWPHDHQCELTRTAMSRAFTMLLALLVAGFFVVPEQQQRNWTLYLAAAAAHAFLFDGRTVRVAFAGRAGWSVPLLLAMPLLSLLWSGPVAGERAADLLLAAYCILTIYVGIVHLTRHAPQQLARLQQVLLLGANLGALLSLGHWAATCDPELPRLPGWLGLDNPVHASILLLAATLPVCAAIARGKLGLRWGWACAAPIAFVLLAGPRAALVSWLIVVAVVVAPRLRLRATLVGAAALAIVATAALIASDALQAIWLDRGLSFRPAIWAQTWSAYLACNPFIGCGIAAPLEIEYQPGSVTDRAHSLYGRGGLSPGNPGHGGIPRRHGMAAALRSCREGRRTRAGWTHCP